MLTNVVLAAVMASSPIYGVANAGDGDSLTIGQTRVRLHGIDAPEFYQQCERGGSKWACGKEAADRLSRLVTGREVRCDPVGLDQHGRTLARCSVGYTDVNRTMVATGYAVAFRRYSSEYVNAEESAKLSKRGMWAGTFDMPSEVRAAAKESQGAGAGRTQSIAVTSRQTRSSGASRSGNCVIKGNRSRRGEWIYHMPGMPYYEQTRAEDIFCTEAQAQAAGYRRARVR